MDRPNESGSTGNVDPRRTMWILYAALCFATLMYLTVLVLQQASGALEEAAPDPFFALVMGISALVMATLSFVLPRRMLTTGIEAMAPFVVEVPDPDGSVLFRERGPTIRKFADPEEVRRATLKISFAPLILRLAFSETVAIFGFVLGIMGHPWTIALPFFCVSWVLLAIHAPRDKAIFGPVAEAFDARFE